MRRETTEYQQSVVIRAVLFVNNVLIYIYIFICMYVYAVECGGRRRNISSLLSLEPFCSWIMYLYLYIYISIHIFSYVCIYSGTRREAKECLQSAVKIEPFCSWIMYLDVYIHIFSHMYLFTVESGGRRRNITVCCNQSRLVREWCAWIYIFTYINMHICVHTQWITVGGKEISAVCCH